MVEEITIDFHFKDSLGKLRETVETKLKVSAGRNTYTHAHTHAPHHLQNMIVKE